MVSAYLSSRARPEHVRGERPDRIATRLNVIQHGHTHIYVLYVAVTLVALLVWASL